MSGLYWWVWDVCFVWAVWRLDRCWTNWISSFFRPDLDNEDEIQ